jgi:hypothetical protein
MIFQIEPAARKRSFALFFFVFFFFCKTRLTNECRAAFVSCV